MQGRGQSGIDINLEQRRVHRTVNPPMRIQTGTAQRRDKPLRGTVHFRSDVRQSPTRIVRKVPHAHSSIPLPRPADAPSCDCIWPLCSCEETRPAKPNAASPARVIPRPPIPGPEGCAADLAETPGCPEPLHKGSKAARHWRGWPPCAGSASASRTVTSKPVLSSISALVAPITPAPITKARLLRFMSISPWRTFDRICSDIQLK